MATAPLVDPGRTPGEPISFRAAIDGPAGRHGSVLIVDLSPLGFMARTTIPLAPGDIVAVRLPQLGPRAARIVWSLGGRTGGAFVEPIADALYARMLAVVPRDIAGWDGY